MEKRIARRFRRENAALTAASLSVVAFSAVVIVIACLCLSSCSIKEDRSACPCWLSVHVDGAVEKAGDVSLRGVSGVEERFAETLTVAGCEDDVLEQVSKEVLSVYAYQGVTRRSLVDGRRLTVVQWNQCDSLYADAVEVDCTGEEARAELTMRKQFATVRINLGKSAEQMKRYSFRVESPWASLDMATLEPLPGAFVFRPEIAPGDNIAVMRVPRQGDPSMVLTVIYTEGVNRADMALDLGGLIAKTGYNWKAPDLEDIFVTLDLSAGTVRVGVADWQDGKDYDIRHVVI